MQVTSYGEVDVCMGNDMMVDTEVFKLWTQGYTGEEDI